MIRFAAAVLVMLYHLAFFSWVYADRIVSEAAASAATFPALISVSWFGWVGVEIFFVLSGIVICLSAEGSTAFGFAKNRIVRLYPAAWICGTIGLVVLILVGEGDLLNRYARTLLLFPSGPWVAVPYWTLAHEMALYALIFLLLLFGRFRYLGHLLAAVGIASAAYWLLVMIDQSRGLPPAIHAILLLGPRVPLRLILWFGCCFALGGFFYLCVRKQCTIWRLAIMAVCVGGCILRIVWRAEKEIRASAMQLDPIVPATVWAIAVLIMAASLIWHEDIKRRFDGQTRILREVGLATYPLYLLHVPVGTALMLGLDRVGVAPALALASTMVTVVALSFVVSLLLERPVQKVLRQALTRSATTFAARMASLRDRRT